MNYNNVVFETSFGKASQLTQSDLVEIAFAGRSNVGKSSLINKIFNRRNLARVSAVPGKTATINFFQAGKCPLCRPARIRLCQGGTGRKTALVGFD